MLASIGHGSYRQVKWREYLNTRGWSSDDHYSSHIDDFSVSVRSKYIPLNEHPMQYCHYVTRTKAEADFHLLNVI